MNTRFPEGKVNDKVGAFAHGFAEDMCLKGFCLDFAYRCGIRKERFRPCLSQRFEAVYNLILLEEVMRQGFQKVPIWGF